MAQAGTTAQVGRTSTTPSPRRAPRGKDGETIEGIVRPRSRSRGRAPTTRRSRCRPTSSAGRTSRTSPPTSASYAGVPGAAPPPKSAVDRAPRSSPSNGCGGCHTLAAASSAASPARTSTRPCQARPRRWSTSRSSTPNAAIAKGYPPTQLCPANSADPLRRRNSKHLVQYLIDSTGSAARAAAMRRRQRRLTPAGARSSRWHHVGEAPDRPCVTASSITPQRYATVTLVALAALVLIVLHRVRRSADGLGTRLPRLAQVLRPTVSPRSHPRGIEYGNRLFTGLVGLAVIAASSSPASAGPTAVISRVFGALLPLGVVGQAMLGALVVKHHLAPGLVMATSFSRCSCSMPPSPCTGARATKPGRAPALCDLLGVWAVRGADPARTADVLPARSPRPPGRSRALTRATGPPLRLHGRPPHSSGSCSATPRSR